MHSSSLWLCCWIKSWINHLNILNFRKQIHFDACEIHKTTKIFSFFHLKQSFLSENVKYLFSFACFLWALKELIAKVHCAQFGDSFEFLRNLTPHFFLQLALIIIKEWNWFHYFLRKSKQTIKDKSTIVHSFPICFPLYLLHACRNNSVLSFASSFSFTTLYSGYFFQKIEINPPYFLFSPSTPFIWKAKMCEFFQCNPVIYYFYLNLILR